MKNQLTSSRDFSRTIKNTVFLYEDIWKENTTMLLHGSRELDKTAKALEIVSNLGSTAVYINTTTSLDNHADVLESIDNLFILAPKFDSPDDKTDYADLVINAIEEVIAETDIRTFVIDSVSRIAALSFGRNASPAYVMKRLVALQIRCNLSLIVISHDSTKATDRALLNLADSELSVAEVETTVPVAEAVEEKTITASGEHDKVVHSCSTTKGLSRRERRKKKRMLAKSSAV